VGCVGDRKLDPCTRVINLRGRYYMVTGRNSAGELINDGQQITRMEALHLYTAENGWFTKK